MHLYKANCKTGESNRFLEVIWDSTFCKPKKVNHMIILPILACRSLLLKSFLEPKIAMIEQMAQGLSLFGVLDMMRKHSSLLASVFTFEGWHDITSEELIHLMVPQYSDEGTKMKNLEINVFKHLMDFITSLQYAGKELTYLICNPYYPSIL